MKSGPLAVVLLLSWLSLSSHLPLAAIPESDALSPTEVALQAMLAERYKDDLDGMVKRGLVRVLVTYSKTHYFIDKGQQHGMSYETVAAFEKAIRKKYVYRGKSPIVLIVPVSRDELLPRLQAGLGDIAIANLTATPERSKLVDFSIPTLTNVSEVLVSSREAPVVSSVDDLSGKTVVVRRSSSHYGNLQVLNRKLHKSGKAAVRIVEADEHLETEDLLDMVNAGLMEYTIADSHLAGLWKEIFPDIRVNDKITIASGEEIAWAVRKGTPKLLKEVNGFVRHHRAGTTFGNVLRNRYLNNPLWAKRALEASERDKFRKMEPLFRTYATRYDLDYLALLAQGFQESGLDHSKHSPAGAVGIMQLMPATGTSLNVGDVRQLEANIHGGAKYIRELMDVYFNEPQLKPVDRMLFAIAAYNAGPNRIQKLRERTAQNGMNPDVWYGNVERSVARFFSQETVQYVANISKYYISYKLIEEQEEKKRQL
jgi:membrane-bound lytic murein transglycosylase MltF